MDIIRVDSQCVIEIITTIEGITFQTDVLTPNAAVETARTDEEGRDSAVITDEVRSLAQRDAQTTVQSKEVIRTSDQSARDGVDLVHRAGTIMAQIVWSVQTVTQFMSGISASSRE